MGQTIISGKTSREKVKDILRELKCNKFLLVCDSSFIYLDADDLFDSAGIPYIKFSQFTPNPLYSDVCNGVKIFNREYCDAIVAVGGGSTLDVAKCIKLYCKMDPLQNYLEQEYNNSGVPLIALPTTAGTGSESTRYAVIYYDGKKQSVTHDSIIPDYVILEPDFLKTLPIYQKECTLLDALCQGIESWWSVNSTDESKRYSKIAVETIMKHMDAYISDNSDEAALQIMRAANWAGRAINIAQTTAAHAMSYKLTSMYGLPHGHAAAICLPILWEYMSNNYDKCTDKRGAKYLETIFSDISYALGCNDVGCAIKKIKQLLCEMSILPPEVKIEDYPILAASVNTTRLKNNPVGLNKETLLRLYRKICDGENKLT